jgi:hypothetical protein
MNKIINLGLPKTGTTSLLNALEFFHFNRGYIHNMHDNSSNFFCGDYVHQLPVEKWIELFPSAIFLLTIRKDPGTWFKSLLAFSEKKANNTAVKNFRKSLYGYEMPHGHKNIFIKKYIDHNRSVIKQCSKRNFKILCWELGDSWKELCSAIKMPIPNLPFPHKNAQKY